MPFATKIAQFPLAKIQPSTTSPSPAKALCKPCFESPEQKVVLFDPSAGVQTWALPEKPATIEFVTQITNNETIKDSPISHSQKVRKENGKTDIDLVHSPAATCDKMAWKNPDFSPLSVNHKKSYDIK
jgi:hypothetical protein